MAQPNTIAFDKERAASYDQRASVWTPTRDALNQLMRLIFAKLPNDAHLLCVGAGTGAEILALAETFPNWHFTAVEPSGAMLDLCRQKAEVAGITERCTFHEGYLDSLPEAEPFDAATSLLVSQFVLQTEERRLFFGSISARLRPGGILISSDISADMDAPTFAHHFEVWMQMQRTSGVPEENLTQMLDSYRKHVAIIPPTDLASLIESAGFEEPVLFYQALLIHAWFARRAGN